MVLTGSSLAAGDSNLHRVAIYDRTSNSTTSRTSRLGQECRLHLQRTGHSGKARFFQDRCGGLGIGPALHRLMTACSNAEIDRVVVGDLSMFSRRSEELALIRETLLSSGVILEVLEDTGPA